MKDSLAKFWSPRPWNCFFFCLHGILISNEVMWNTRRACVSVLVFWAVLTNVVPIGGAACGTHLSETLQVLLHFMVQIASYCKRQKCTIFKKVFCYKTDDHSRYTVNTVHEKFRGPLACGTHGRTLLPMSGHSSACAHIAACVHLKYMIMQFFWTKVIKPQRLIIPET